MPKPQYSARIHVQAMLTQDQILCLLTADPDTGEVGELDEVVPGWLIEECHDRGLVTPGSRPGAWKLSVDGWDARAALLAE